MTEIKREDIIEIPFGTELYPKEWSVLDDAPERIYAVGDISLLKRRKLAVVGSRRTPTQMLAITANIAKELSRHFALVTGIADGGDSAVIEGGLAGGVICVLAGGFSALPQCNLSLLSAVKKQGLLLSPYPFEAAVRSYSYEYRNKLLAALGEGVLVTSAGEKSGALITAKYAKAFNKPVFAFPYSVKVTAGVGCNGLIKSGAHLTECTQDILTVFGIEERAKTPNLVLTEEEQRLYDTVKLLSDGHVSEIAQKTGIPPYKIRGALSALEIKGVVVCIGGNRYSAL